MDELGNVRWASRVNPAVVRRLYETDARGIVDAELIDKVGWGLYARRQSIRQATTDEGRDPGRQETRPCVRA